MVKRRRARLAVLGGTFDHLHAGHRQLLAAAFTNAGQVGIGVTTPTFLRSHPKRAQGRLQPYSIRRSRLTRYLRTHYGNRRWWLVPLRDGIGGALAPEVDLIVASAETGPGAQRIVAERRRLRLPRARVRLVPIALADDLLPLSSSRIRMGLVDEDGRRRRPVRLAYPAGTPATLRDRIAEALTHVFPAGVRFAWVPRKLPAQSRGRTFSRARALAVQLLGDADWSVGILPSSSPRGRADSAWVTLAGPMGPLSPAHRRGRSPGPIAAQLRTQLAPRLSDWVGRRPDAAVRA